MNKSDIKLIVVITVISFIVIFLFQLFKNNDSKEAVVYYQNKVVLKIDLTVKEKREYHVKGANGDILIVSEDGKVRVNEENSPLHLCSKQGWIKNSYESIVCLPNKVVIKIETKEEIDAIAK